MRTPPRDERDHGAEEGVQGDAVARVEPPPLAKDPLHVNRHRRNPCPNPPARRLAPPDAMCQSHQILYPRGRQYGPPRPARLQEGPLGEGCLPSMGGCFDRHGPSWLYRGSRRTARAFSPGLSRRPVKGCEQTHLYAQSHRRDSPALASEGIRPFVAYHFGKRRPLPHELAGPRPGGPEPGRGLRKVERQLDGKLLYNDIQKTGRRTDWLLR